MLRASHLSPLTSPALCALRHSLVPSFNISSSLSVFQKPSNFASFHTLLPQTPTPNPLHHLPSRAQPMVGPFPCPKASFSSGSSSGDGREILVQHLLVKEDDLKLLLELQQRISEGEDLSDLAVEYSICPSKEEGGMLGWVRKGQMVPEFEEAAFNSPLNKVVRCKTKFGWHLLQVLSEREESLLQEIQPDELNIKMQDPNFLEEAQLIDVREPEEVALASLPGFQVLPLRQFGSWGPDIITKFDPQKDTYVMCHHGMRSLQLAKWLQTQGFRRIFNVSGGIHAYATKISKSRVTGELPYNNSGKKNVLNLYRLLPVGMISFMVPTLFICTTTMFLLFSSTNYDYSLPFYKIFTLQLGILCALLNILAVVFSKLKTKNAVTN